MFKNSIECVFKIENFKYQIFKNLFCFTFGIFKHKFFEFEMYFYTDFYTGFELSIQFTGEDHAGPELEIGILGLVLHFHLYDSRHWDEENNCWLNNEVK